MNHRNYLDNHEESDLDLKFEELALATAKRIRTFFTKALYAFAVIGVSSAIALLGFGLVLTEQRKITYEIQEQRFNTLYDICVDQNMRHNRAIAAAKKILPVRTHDTVFRLIDQLVPYTESCLVYTRNRVKGTG